MTENWTYILPLGISRWWDILIGPIWSSLLILLGTSQRVREDKGLFGPVVGLLAFGLADGLAGGLAFGLAFGLVFCLAGGLAFGLVFCLAGGLGFGLVFCLAVGLKWLGQNFRPGLVKVRKWLLAENN